jgi:ribonuclease HI
MRETAVEQHFSAGRPSAPMDLPEGAVIGTDGSGGPHSAEPRLRRCGWGFVVLDHNLETIATGQGPLHYHKQTVPLSELEAVKVAVLSTQGNITVVIDNAVIVRGIRKGPHAKHRFNTHAWKLFWECVGDGVVTAVKVKSHQTAEAARDAGVEHQHWLANHLADQLADEAALSAQLPAQDIIAVQQEDRRAREVQEHLRAVAFAVAQAAPLLYGPSTRLERAQEARARAQDRRAALEAALATTQHRWCAVSGRCLTCLRGPAQSCTKGAFLRTECEGRPHQIHSSHRLRRHRGLWFCVHCGATGSRRFSARGLGGPCHPPTPSGTRTITRLLAGVLPYHRQAWPDEEEEEASGLVLVS